METVIFVMTLSYLGQNVGLVKSGTPIACNSYVCSTFLELAGRADDHFVSIDSVGHVIAWNRMFAVTSKQDTVTTTPLANTPGSSVYESLNS